MNSERRDVFLKYLSYGGIKVSPKMFGGNDQKDLQKLDSEEIVTATAITNIPEDRAGWDVDFETVAKGFLYDIHSKQARWCYYLLTVQLAPLWSRRLLVSKLNHRSI